MKRSALEVMTRCSRILNDEGVISLVTASSSPSAAYEMIFTRTKDVTKSKAGRWLAILRRDYPEEYSQLTEPNKQPRQNGTAN